MANLQAGGLKSYAQHTEAEGASNDIICKAWGAVLNAQLVILANHRKAVEVRAADAIKLSDMNLKDCTLQPGSNINHFTVVGIGLFFLPFK